MVPAVTIVLPVHNAERSLRGLITRILDLTVAPSRGMTVAIVDDGSTDDTFDTACELARDFPQVRVMRQAYRKGLGPALEEVRRTLRVEEVIVHDGIGTIDLNELSAMLNGAPQHAAAVDVEEGRGSRRFATVSALNTRMAEAHRAVSSLRWLRLSEPTRPRRRLTPLTNLAGPSFGEGWPASTTPGMSIGFGQT